MHVGEWDGDMERTGDIWHYKVSMAQVILKSLRFILKERESHWCVLSRGVKL